MSKSQVETYTISSNPSSSYSSSNISHLEIPANGNDIKIIITEATPPGYNTSPRIHFVEPNSTNNRTLTQIETPKTMSTVEVIEMPPSDKQNISRGLQTDLNNPSVATWIIDGKNSSSNSDRYKEVEFNKRRKFIVYSFNKYLPIYFYLVHFEMKCQIIWALIKIVYALLFGKFIFLISYIYNIRWFFLVFDQ